MPPRSERGDIMKAMKRAEDLETRRQEKAAQRGPPARPKIAARVKGVERWGGKMFSRLFYSSLARLGIECRDETGAEDTLPRYVREMNLFLALAEKKGYTKRAILEAFTRMFDEWSAGSQQKLSGRRKVSVYDLRYRLQFLFGNKIPVVTTRDPIDLSAI